tara:strand:+ start:11502 stop:11759 length:258 start_codon:yes stop_codon:yes gene_type:complete
MAQGQTAYSLTGGNGGKLINDTGTHTGSWQTIQAVNGAAAVLNHAGTICNIEDFDANTTIDSGQELYGKFTQITLNSGSVIAYKR